MKKLNKELLLEMINEFLSLPDGAGVDGVISNEPIVSLRNYDPTDNLLTFEDDSERIVELIHDFTSNIRSGLKSGDISPIEGQKIVDFQISRIQRALEYVIETIDAETGEDNLDMTTPEV
tara:strand:+ start:318 stop:677 length:360 start_codon:yes stop_codon:yes gene_type:complete